ncbi:MAG TPA: VCBS repeat-containing protein [Kiritimatiellia bacterium]|nr:VCBS repeat-containing protein [Kiritimatiellia bacterium]
MTVVLVIIATSCAPLPYDLSLPSNLENPVGVKEDILLSEPNMGLIWDMRRNQEGSLVVLASRGVLVVSGDNEKWIDFEIPEALSEGTLVDIEKSGTFEVLGNLPNEASVVRIDGHGRVIWRFPAEGYDHPQIADFNNDGILDVLFLNPDGKLCLHYGDTRRPALISTDIVPWRYLAGDFDMDRKTDIYIYEFTDRGCVSVISPSGVLLCRFEPKDVFYAPGIFMKAGMPLISVAVGDEFRVMEPCGKVVSRFSAPLGRYVRVVRGVALKPDEGGWIVFLAHTRGAWHRSLLYVYSADGVLKYETVIGDDAESFMVERQEMSGSLTVLVGTRDEVRRYVLQP